MATALGILLSLAVPQAEAEGEVDQATGTSVILQNGVNSPISFYYSASSNGLFSSAPRSLGAGRVIELACPYDSCTVGVQQNGARRVFSVEPARSYKFFVGANGTLQLGGI